MTLAILYRGETNNLTNFTHFQWKNEKKIESGDDCFERCNELWGRKENYLTSSLYVLLY